MTSRKNNLDTKFLDLIKSSKSMHGRADMKNLVATSRNFLFAILVPTLLLLIICGCAPKIYLSSYSDPEYNFSEIKKVAIVLENIKRICTIRVIY